MEVPVPSFTEFICKCHLITKSSVTQSTVQRKLHDSLSPRWNNPLTACTYLDNHVMLLVYGYCDRRHRSAIKAVGKTGDCTSAAPWKTWWWHCPVCGWTDTTTLSHAHALSCTLMHTRGGQTLTWARGHLNKHYKIQCSNWDKFVLSSHIILHSPHYRPKSQHHIWNDKKLTLFADSRKQ